MGELAAAQRVAFFIRGAEEIGLDGDEGLVEIAFGHEAAAGFVDGADGIGAVEGEIVGSDADDWTVEFVTLEDCLMGSERVYLLKLPEVG